VCVCVCVCERERERERERETIYHFLQTYFCYISYIHLVTIHRKAVVCFLYIATAMSVVTAEIGCYVDKKVLRF
jgi:hypothetical protein